MPIPTPGLTLLAGSLHSRKTALALDLAVCIALGKPWLSQPVQQSPVLYSDEEQGTRAFLPRVRTALLGHAADQQTSFHFLSFGFDRRRPHELIEQAASLQARFVVIDSIQPILTRSHTVFKTSLLTTLISLQTLAHRHQLSVLAVIHASYRGLLRNAATLSTVCDLLLSVSSSPLGYTITSLNTAQPPITAGIYQSGGGLRLQPLAQPSPRFPRLQSAILAQLSRSPASLASLPGSEASLYKALRRLRYLGLVTRTNTTLPANYALTAQGHAVACQVRTPPLSASRGNNFKDATACLTHLG